jgi:hypothetical protein
MAVHYIASFCLDKTNSISRNQRTVDLHFDAKGSLSLVRGRSICRNGGWVEAENKVTYLFKPIPFRDALKPHGETMEL